MNLTCPECGTLYRVDPDRVPDGGTAARCRQCGTAFRVDPASGPAAPGTFSTAPRANARTGNSGAEAPGPGGRVRRRTAEGAETGPEEPSAPATPAEAPTPGAKAPAFGPQDPHTRAHRLARALVSDIKAYHPEKWQSSAESGTLRKDFRDEILKSWEEYVEQVGEKMAKKTPYFRDALNEILAQGEAVF